MWIIIGGGLSYVYLCFGYWILIEVLVARNSDLIVDNRGYSTPHPLMSCNEKKLPSGHAEPVPRSRAKPEQFLATRAGTTVSRCVNFGRNTLEGWNMMES
jgi:hypothetical protein